MRLELKIDNLKRSLYLSASEIGYRNPPPKKLYFVFLFLDFFKDFSSFLFPGYLFVCFTLF